MHNKTFKAVVSVIVAVLLMAAGSVIASAEITAKGGTVTGLDATVGYQYAQVDVLSWQAPAYTALPLGSTEIKGLGVGLWNIKDTSTGAVKTVWIAGDKKDRSDIGEVYYNSSCGKDVVRTSSTTSWISGQWTGPTSVNHSTFPTYYISSHSHIASSYAQGLSEGTVSQTKVRTLTEEVYYRYAYAPEEIIPVEELYTMGFNVGVRQTAFSFAYSDTAPDKSLKSIYNLYTMDDAGQVTVHSTTKEVNYASGNYHSIAIGVDFPDATGWVVGIEIFPYGSIPKTGLRISSFKNNNTTYINTCFYIEYMSDMYSTKGSSNTVSLPFQYNGTNVAYIEGYGDGSFKPDGSITKAELSAILARLVTNGNVPQGAQTRFSDHSVNDWYYDAVNYLEAFGIFDYVEGTRLNADKPLTRGEFAKMIYGFFSLVRKDTANFSDVTDATPYSEAILTLADHGFIKGYEDGTFRPDATVTRAEAVTVINRIININANDSITENTLENNFLDIHSHWAKNQILYAANDNVKTDRHLNADGAALLQTDSTVQIETDHVKIVIDRKNGKVTGVINKDDSSNVLGASTTPWFSYITIDSGFNFTPKAVDVVDNRLHFVYANGIEAYFVVETFDNYFTLELDSELPIGTKSIHFGEITVNTEFSDDEDSYRISGVSMTINTNMVNRPGGKQKKTTAYTMRAIGPMGAKFAITFSRFGGSKNGEHREYLKEILDAIDETKGITSTKGSAYTYDNTDVYGDYVIQSGGLTASNATSTAQTLKKYSIDQLDFHQGGSSFIQGDFNFKCAAVSGETFTTAAQFRERIGKLVNAEGVQLGLHTYSSLISSSATKILTNPKWQKQIMHVDSENLTLASDVSATATSFPTVEDASFIKITGEQAGGGTSSIPWSGPNTGYFLIDEEIVLVTAIDATGLTAVSRGNCGTTAVAHSAGTTIIHYLGHYGMFQSMPGTELFYHVADETARAYNDGGFEMIYLDGFESFSRELFAPSETRWYYQAAFIHRLVSQCDVDPIIEGSDFPVCFWAARARGGAVDHATRETKQYNLNHLRSNVNFLDAYLTATLGWFHFSPDMTATYKNTYSKTMFRDDLDYMGSMGIAFEMSNVANGFSVSTYSSYRTISDNTLYHSLYARLRKANYFSEAVKKTLQQGILSGKEYRLQEQSDGTWAFREMTYFKHKVFDLKDTAYATGKGTNPYDAQAPYIRIEQRFSTKGANEKQVIAFDETAEVSTLAGKKHTFATTNLSSYRAFKIKVYGNGDATGGILLTMGSQSVSETGRLDFFLPTAHTGWREFIIIDADNADYAGYDFPGDYLTSCHYQTFRNGYDFTTANSVTVNVAGNVAGVMIDDLMAYTISNSPVKNPSVTINGSTITFSATVRSGEYIEYIPELNKAYHHSYNKTTGKPDNGNTATVKEISFSGSVTVPAGDFTYTYNATSEVSWIESLANYYGGPIRAKVVIGLESSELIENEDTWEATLPDIQEDLQYITLK